MIYYYFYIHVWYNTRLIHLYKMHSSDLKQQVLLKNGMPVTVLTWKDGRTPIRVMTGRGLDIYGDGFFSDLWDGAKKIVGIGKEVYDVAKPVYDAGTKVYDAGTKVYDAYKRIKGSGVYESGLYDPEVWSGGSVPIVNSSLVAANPYASHMSPYAGNGLYARYRQERPGRQSRHGQQHGNGTQQELARLIEQSLRFNSS